MKTPPQFLAGLLRKKTLRNKLTLAVVVTCLTGILMASAALFAHQALKLRSHFRQQMQELAEIVATYAIAPVSFGDQTGMQEALAVLQARTEVLRAELKNPEGKLLARFGPSATGEARLPAGELSSYDGWELLVTRPLALKQENLGTLTIVATFRPAFVDAALDFLPILALVIVGSLIAITLFTRFFTRVLLAGLNRLADSAAHIASTADYSERATQTSSDEVGQVTATFNHMLDRLQQGDSELRAANTRLTREIQERHRLQSALIETSRFAGMAEVATGVLHNVGNVLNSVNISAQVMRERLDSSQLANLGRAANLIRQQNDQAARFMLEDDHGRQLPAFIVGVSDALHRESTLLERELSELTQNIDHIKEIVAAQQNYAKIAGVAELLDPRDLFTEAMRLTEAYAEQQKVKLTKDYPEVPLISIDRHGLLQILVNFLTNAIHAVKANPSNQRCIIMRLVLTGPDHLCFVVEDNGVGITPQNLKRIFTHGFTTRSDGHGFGLHNGANTARLLGGSIRVETDGPGRGARFFLEIPVTTKTAVLEPVIS